MKEGVYGSFASKLCEDQIFVPSVHKVSHHSNSKFRFGAKTKGPDFCSNSGCASHSVVSCLFAEHVSECCRVQQQPEGPLRGRHGPGGGALFAARARHRRLAHIQPGGGLQPGSATLQHHRRPGATRILRGILCRLVRRPALLCVQQRFVAQLLILGSSSRFEMQDAGVTYLKNVTLVPYFLDSSKTEAALSVPA